MTSGNVTSINPVMPKTVKGMSKDDVNASPFYDVMKDSVKKNDITNRPDNSINLRSDSKSQDNKLNNKPDDTKVDKTEPNDKLSDDKKSIDKTVKADDKTKIKDDNLKSEDKNIFDDNLKSDETVEEKIPDEVIELVSEVINNFASDVKDVLTQALDINSDELSDVMSDMDITFADLLDPKEVNKLMVEAGNGKDSVSLVLDEDLSNALSEIRELSAQVLDETNLDTPVIQDVIREVSKESVAVEDIDITSGNATAIDNALSSDNLRPSDTLKADMGDAEALNDIDMAKQDIGTDYTAKSVAYDDTTKDSSKDITIGNNDNVTDNTFDVKQSGESDNAKSFTGSDARHSHNMQESMQGTVVINNQLANEQVVEAPPVNPTFNRFESMQLISQITEAARVNISDEVTSLEMILNPESLGKIYLNVSKEQGALKAQIMAQNETVKEAIEQQVILLKENLNKAGIKVEAVEVSVATHEFERNLEEGMHQQEEQARQQEENASKARRKSVSINLNNLDELQGLMSEDDRLMAQMMIDQGNSMSIQA